MEQECIAVGCVPPASVAISGSGGLPGGVHPSVNRITDRCKNTTLPQTSFTGGKSCL